MPISNASPPSTVYATPKNSSFSSLLHPKNFPVSLDDAGGRSPASSSSDHHLFLDVAGELSVLTPPLPFLKKDTLTASMEVLQEPSLNSPSASQFYLSAVSESFLSGAPSFTDALDDGLVFLSPEPSFADDESWMASDAGNDECFLISDDTADSPPSGGHVRRDSRDLEFDGGGGGGRNKPRVATDDERWEAIRGVQSSDGCLRLSHFRVVKMVGRGGIGTVYMSELSRTGTLFAMKVMDKAVLARSLKLERMQMERDVLERLNHPFLPTLYAHLETDDFSCLLMDFCPGGNLLALRKRQPRQRFSEHTARFYAAEVLLALEYLHMLGIIYRDLKPENVLIREDGHIMLADFDLCLRCAVHPTVVNYKEVRMKSGSCIGSFCCKTTCFLRGYSRRKKTNSSMDPDHNVRLLELVAEPRNVKSMSIVGTLEYLAPEIIEGSGHGSAVDWWTFGIFLFELLYGKTPFRGSGDGETLSNVVREPLKFPDFPALSYEAKDLIRSLLVKDPHKRLGCKHGALEIRHHQFFRSINWALIRWRSPLEVAMGNNDNKLEVKDNQISSTKDSAGVYARPSQPLYMDFF